MHLPAMRTTLTALVAVARLNDPHKGFTTLRVGHPHMAVAASPSCSDLVQELFSGVVDPAAVASACSATVEWDDLTAPAPITGPEAVRAHLEAKFPKGSVLVLDRISDGQRSGGFTWHREEEMMDGSRSAAGLRGTLYCELDDAGALLYVREGCEPIVKPGQATEALLKAATQNIERPEKPPPSYTQATPTSASGIARYLWEDAYPGGAEPAEALRLFADDIVYEDFNYPQPFTGKRAVADFVNAFDIPGIAFVPLRISEGERGCAFTWRVLINGQEGPEGISFYEINDAGQVAFLRGMPMPMHTHMPMHTCPCPCPCPCARPRAHGHTHVRTCACTHAG